MTIRVALMWAFLQIAAALTFGQSTRGIWEGVVQNAARPLVVNVDLDKRTAKVDATGSTIWNIENLVTDGRGLGFDASGSGNLLHFDSKVDGDKIAGRVKSASETIPFWLDRLPVLPMPKDRVEAWNQDIDVLVNRFLRYDRSYSDAARRQVRSRAARLRSALVRLTDQEVIVELARIVALSGNAHTRLYLVRNRTEVRRLPVRVWWFGNELRVVGAMPEHKDLLGCRVVRVGDLSVYEAARRVSYIKAGNESWQRYMSTYLLTSPDILFGAHLTPSPDETYLTVNCGDTDRRVKVAALPLRKDNNPLEAWWDLTPDAREQNAPFIPVLDAAKAPLYLKRTKDNYWFEYLADAKILYFQFNRSQQSPGETMAAFGDRLIGELGEQRPDALVVDLRFNTGGDLTVAKPFIRKLSNEIGSTRVFVITGQATFSAGITAAVELVEWAHATIVGTHAGDELDSWSEGGNLLMPNSKLTLHYGNAFHSYSKREFPDRKPYVEDMSVSSIEPGIRIENMWPDYVAGHDRVLDEIISLLKTTHAFAGERTP